MNFFHLLGIILITPFLTEIVQADIQVYNYDELPPQYRDSRLKSIKFSTANFGFVP